MDFPKEKIDFPKPTHHISNSVSFPTNALAHFPLPEKKKQIQKDKIIPDYFYDESQKEKIDFATTVKPTHHISKSVSLTTDALAFFPFPDDKISIQQSNPYLKIIPDYFPEENSSPNSKRNEKLKNVLHL